LWNFRSILSDCIDPRADLVNWLPWNAAGEGDHGNMSPCLGAWIVKSWASEWSC